MYLFLKSFYLFICFRLCWVFVAAQTSPVVAGRNYSLAGGFPLLWLLSLWNAAVVAALGLLRTSSVVCGA